MNGTRNAREQTSGRDTYLIRVLMMISKPIGSDIQPGKERVKYERKIYRLYELCPCKEELQKNGYLSVSAGNQSMISWYLEFAKRDNPKVKVLDLSNAGMELYIITRKYGISNLEKLVKQNIANKQKELDELIKAARILRREENR